MNRDTIKKTAICRYEQREKVYIVESPLLDILHGIAETEEESWDIFYDLLDSMYIKYLEGKRVGNFGKGRPAKNRIDLHAQIQARTKEKIDQVAADLGISKGEAIDCLAFGYVAPPKSQKNNMVDGLPSKSSKSPSKKTKTRAKI